jgi:P27 family predicted phage terminase small subunit
MPEPPPGLLKETREIWRAFWDAPISKAVNIESDLPQLERWIQNVDEYHRVRRVLIRSRLVHGSGQTMVNPLASYLAALVPQIEKSEEAFGMTPASRARLGLLDHERLTAAQLNRMLNEADDEPQAKGIVGRFFRWLAKLLKLHA